MNAQVSVFLTFGVLPIGVSGGVFPIHRTFLSFDIITLFQDDQIEAYLSRAMLVNIVWAFGGDGKWKSRQQLSDFVRQSSTLPLPPNAAVNKCAYIYYK